MENSVSKSSTNDARAMWQVVSEVAQNVPDWVRPQVSAASESTVRHLTQVDPPRQTSS